MKIAWDPGHGDGDNIGPGDYREGTVMRMLANSLCDSIDGSIITRTGPSNISFYERASIAKNNNCDLLISLHTNAPPADGILIFYSIFRPEDKLLAQRIGQSLSENLGLRIRGIMTRKSLKGNWDYYGIIRNSINCGLSHVLIIEHGHHGEFAEDISNNIAKTIKAYEEVLDDLNISRIAGVNRYDTAANISRVMYPSGADSVILVSGENYPDALCSGTLINNLDVPILLTHCDSLDECTKNEIVRLKAKNVIIVGGVDAVSDCVEQKLREI